MLIVLERSTGDFPSVLYDVLSKRSSVTTTSLSIGDVNDALDEISKAAGKMSVDMSHRVFVAQE